MSIRLERFKVRKINQFEFGIFDGRPDLCDFERDPDEELCRCQHEEEATMICDALNGRRP